MQLGVFIYWVGYISNIVISGFAVTWLWAWFIMPLGIQAISVPHAIGLTCLLSTLFGGVSLPSRQAYLENLFTIMYRSFKTAFAPVLPLVLGWCVSNFVL